MIGYPLSKIVPIICQSLGTLALSIYILVQGVNYPTPGGCTSLDNGDLPNQTGLDMGWWFEVYGAVGLTVGILIMCTGMAMAGDTNVDPKERSKATTQFLSYLNLFSS